MWNRLSFGLLFIPAPVTSSTLYQPCPSTHAQPHTLQGCAREAASLVSAAFWGLGGGEAVLWLQVSLSPACPKRALWELVLPPGLGLTPLLSWELGSRSITHHHTAIYTVSARAKLGGGSCDQ